MANYKQSIVSGEITSWIRSNTVNISNEYGAIPSISFGEQKITVLPDGTLLCEKRPPIIEMFSDPSKSFDILSPENDAVLGSSTYMELYVLVYSLYRKLANDRDIENEKPLEYKDPGT
jgi:hypothetical protein